MHPSPAIRIPSRPLAAVTSAAPAWACLALALTAAATTAQTPPPLSYNRDVRPILSNNCFQCHGPDANTREADLRLDDRDAAVEAEAIVPGSPERSELVYRITTGDADDVMPPPDSIKSLNDDERAILSRWIAEGAAYEPHWSYLPPRRPALPAASDADHPVDAFIEARLQDAGIEPSPEADRRTLLRRLSLDLTGLPPTPEETRAFLDDERPDAFARQVDRLLASPRFGERMAVAWLDVVRYADTVGYHGDQERDVTPYRDYVIASFNANKPFDRFTIEQLAGDLMEEPTRESRVATTYNRLNPISGEGGIQDAEYLAKYQGERVRTTATAWLGSTLACAECHDHKFDPFSMRDFYAMAAFFADIYEKGAFNGDGRYNEGVDLAQLEDVSVGQWGPFLRVPTAEDEQRLAELAALRARLEADLAARTPERDAAFTRWLEDVRNRALDGGPADAVVLDDREIPVPDGVEIVTRETGPVASGEIARRQTSDGLVQHIMDLGERSFAVAAGDRLFAHVRLDPQRPPRQVMLQFHADDGSQWNHRAWWGADEIPYGKGSNGPDHRHLGDLPATGQWVRLEVDAAAVGLAPGTRITQFAFTQFGGSVVWDHAGRRTDAAAAALAGIPEAWHPALRDPDATLDPAAIDGLRAHWRTVAPELAEPRDRLAATAAEEKAVRDALRTTLVSVASTPREIRVLPRGNWMDRSGEIVAPAIPAFLPGGTPTPDTGDRRLTRLDLARWLVSPDNPLTARTFVNRLWHQFFGTGISRVLDDLGSQGEWPTHPELLDWLAVEFMECGWDVKHLARLLVTSHTYRQTSDSTPEGREADPLNRLFSRQTPRRLEAEFIRDQALAVAGLLNETMGGRSARPYQPAGYYRNLNFPRREYQPDQDASQYRRGVYMHWQRTFLHPMLAAFDAPPREECVAERTVSNTPLQSLNLLNDPTFVEAARALAERLLRDLPEATPEDRIRAAFEITLGRPAEDAETALLADLLADQRARFAAAPAEADALLAVGLHPVAGGVDRIELAATTAATRALLCLHETLTRY